eukprot:174076-Amphidinium_carterae.3
MATGKISQRALSGKGQAFIYKWPEPEEPNEMRTEAQLLAAMVLDDYDHHTSMDFVASNAPVYKELDIKARICKAELWLQLPSMQGGDRDQLEFDPFDHELLDQSDPED